MNVPLIKRANKFNKNSKPIKKGQKTNFALEMKKKELQRKAGWAKYYECEDHLSKVLGDVYHLKQELKETFPEKLQKNLEGAMKLIARNLKGRKDSECSICTVSDFTPENLAVTCCGHYFHNECLKQWKDQGKTTCPECREEQN